MLDQTWVTNQGDSIPYNKITDSHLENILQFIKQKSVEGITLKYGHNDGWDGPSYWEEDLIGEEVLDHFDYQSLLAELNKRKTKTITGDN